MTAGGSPAARPPEPAEWKRPAAVASSAPLQLSKDETRVTSDATGLTLGCFFFTLQSSERQLEEVPGHVGGCKPGERR